jgi:hypothetical protein
MIEIKSLDLPKKVLITGACAINSEYKFRKGIYHGRYGYLME